MPVIAPLVILVLGFGLAPKVLLVALVCFFPVTINLSDGLRRCRPRRAQAAALVDATRWQTLRFLEVPAALPGPSPALKIAAAGRVIGAVFAEWAGSDAGLGHALLTANGQLGRRARSPPRSCSSRSPSPCTALFALLERAVVSGPACPEDHDAACCSPRCSRSLASPPAARRTSRRRRRPGKTEPLTLVLDYFPNADHAGIYAAQARGRATSAGLDVEIPRRPTRPRR